MPHFAVIAPPFTSHVRALAALAEQLLQRGHRVSWIAQADVQAVLPVSAENSGISGGSIAFHAVGNTSHPPGSLVQIVARAANPGGPLGLRRVIADVAALTDMLCREAPAVLKTIRADAIIADQMEAAGGLVAESLGLPLISVACALPVNRDPRVPLPVMPWGFAKDLRGEQLNEGSTRVYDWLMQPHARVIARHAAAFGLKNKQTIADCLSPLAQISQTTASFDFARNPAFLPPHFHHVGPLRPPPQAQAPLDLLTDPARPFVFASLGTLQGGRFGLFKRMAKACRALDMQLLLAHCNQLNPAQAQALKKAGATWVTGFAPQIAAVARADIVMTHAGLNTVMDALAAGKPMLALPIAFDQPGVAARVVHGGAGLRLLPPLASSAAIGKALQRLLHEKSFAESAQTLGADVQTAGGVSLAADITEAAAVGRKPVLAKSLAGSQSPAAPRASANANANAYANGNTINGVADHGA